MIKSPSKHTKLSTLKAIKVNHYQGLCGNDFAPCEVDQLIIEKEMKLAESLCKKAPDRYFKNQEAKRMEWDNV